jgi:hypothetical protein
MIRSGPSDELLKGAHVSAPDVSRRVQREEGRKDPGDGFFVGEQILHTIESKSGA